MFGPRGSGKTFFLSRIIANYQPHLIERHKPRLFFVLTGSSARKLKDVEANLLAGRALRENFFRLGIEEIPEHTSFDSLLQLGTLPVVITEIDDELKLRSFFSEA